MPLRAKKTLKAAFPHTIPVMTGYLFLGAAFGILLQSKGYSHLWAGLMSVTIFAGSVQFVAVNLLTGAFSLLNAFFITLMVNARHVFYGFSMLERFQDTGKYKPYLIFALSDETFTLLYSAEPPEGVRRGSFYFCIALLDQLYWIAGSITGALIGSRLSFDVQGIEFVMTALFVAIFTEQCRVHHNRIPAVVGLAGSALCLLVFGPERFILPAMLVLVLVLTLIRKPMERGLAQQ